VSSCLGTGRSDVEGKEGQARRAWSTRLMVRGEAPTMLWPHNDVGQRCKGLIEEGATDPTQPGDDDVMVTQSPMRTIGSVAMDWCR
jgi:hypothetical protein